jgi:hypothetical protein
VPIQAPQTPRSCRSKVALSLWTSAADFVI